jgi:hypothetical protein
VGGWVGGAVSDSGLPAAALRCAGVRCSVGAQQSRRSGASKLPLCLLVAVLVASTGAYMYRGRCPPAVAPPEAPAGGANLHMIVIMMYDCDYYRIYMIYDT